MQYVSSFSPLGVSDDTPTTVFFDDRDDLPDLSEETINDVFRLARSCLGTAYQLNPVRGQEGNNYHLTFLRSGLKGTAEYAEGNSLASALQLRGTTHQHVSQGKSSYTIGPTSYAYQRTVNTMRLPILIPDGVHTFRYPEFEVATNQSTTLTFYYYQFKGATRTSSAFYASSPSNYKGVTVRADVTIADGVYCAECIWGTYGGSNYYQTPDNSASDIQYISHDLLTDHDELVNLSHAYICLSDKYVKMRKNIHYSVEDDLIPGARPKITFIPTVLSI